MDAGDHPRVRGEQSFRTACSILRSGSPPLTRGKDVRESGYQKRDRITPAYAGKSSGTAHSRKRRKDHPRLRGEKIHTEGEPTCRRGSPPLTRGKDRGYYYRLRDPGITPAYAGKRLKKSHKIGLRQFAKRPIPLTSQIRQRSKSNPPRPGAHRKHPSQSVQQASSAYNL